LWEFFGSKSRAPGISEWGRQDDTEKLLTGIADLLDEVYGKMSPETIWDDKNKRWKEDKDDLTFGRELMGKVMARIIKTKALASVYQLEPSSFKQVVRDATARKWEEGYRPLAQPLMSLWGSDLHGENGLLRKWIGPRLGFKFILEENRFNAEKDLAMTKRLLETNDSDPTGVGRIALAELVGSLSKGIAAFGSLSKGK